VVAQVFRGKLTSARDFLEKGEEKAAAGEHD